MSPSEASPLLARLYSAAEADLAGLVAELSVAWTMHGPDGEPLGVLALRPTPARGAELVGGAFLGTAHGGAALALVQAALTEQPQLYAYAESHLLPEEALEAAGLQRVSAYTHMVGALPDTGLELSPEFQFVPLSQASPADRLAAQHFYSDRLGHTAVSPEAAAPSFGGSDDHLGLLALDRAGQPAGLCRVWLEGDAASMTTPAVRPDLRGGELRRALLLSAFAAAHAAGATHLTLEAWGDTDAEREADAALNLNTEVRTPIYASLNQP